MITPIICILWAINFQFVNVIVLSNFKILIIESEWNSSELLINELSCQTLKNMYNFEEYSTMLTKIIWRLKRHNTYKLYKYLNI